MERYGKVSHTQCVACAVPTHTKMTPVVCASNVCAYLGSVAFNRPMKNWRVSHKQSYAHTKRWCWVAAISSDSFRIGIWPLCRYVACVTTTIVVVRLFSWFFFFFGKCGDAAVAIYGPYESFLYLQKAIGRSAQRTRTHPVTLHKTSFFLSPIFGDISLERCIGEWTRFGAGEFGLVLIFKTVLIFFFCLQMCGCVCVGKDERPRAMRRNAVKCCYLANTHRSDGINYTLQAKRLHTQPANKDEFV